jgi:hypothetical protein
MDGVALEGEDIALVIESDPCGLGNAPQILAVGAKECVGQLEVIKDNLLNRFILLFCY